MINFDICDIEEHQVIKKGDVINLNGYVICVVDTHTSELHFEDNNKVIITDIKISDDGVLLHKFDNLWYNISSADVTKI